MEVSRLAIASLPDVCSKQTIIMEGIRTKFGIEVHHNTLVNSTGRGTCSYFLLTTSAIFIFFILRHRSPERLDLISPNLVGLSYVSSDNFGQKWCHWLLPLGSSRHHCVTRFVEQFTPWLDGEPCFIMFMSFYHYIVHNSNMNGGKVAEFSSPSPWLSHS